MRTRLVCRESAICGTGCGRTRQHCAVSGCRRRTTLCRTFKSVGRVERERRARHTELFRVRRCNRKRVVWFCFFACAFTLSSRVTTTAGAHPRNPTEIFLRLKYAVRGVSAEVAHSSPRRSKLAHFKEPCAPSTIAREGSRPPRRTLARGKVRRCSSRKPKKPKGLQHSLADVKLDIISIHVF